MNIRQLRFLSLNFQTLMSPVALRLDIWSLRRERWAWLIPVLAILLQAPAVWAGSGQCIWGHLPQAKRSQIALLEDYDIANHAETVFAGFSEKESASAAKACGVEKNASDEILTAVVGAGIGWGLQERSEKELFAEVHIPADVLDAGWQHLDPALKAYFTSQVEAQDEDEKAKSAKREKLLSAMGFKKAPTGTEEDAIGLYVFGRALRYLFESKF